MRAEEFGAALIHSSLDESKMSQSQSEQSCEVLLSEMKMSNSHDVERGTQSTSGVQDCKNRDYRTLAISSIICGLSCIGLLSLVYSVKARAMNKGKLNPGEVDRETKAREYSRKALKYGILAILLWAGMLIAFPLLAGLVSYLLTLKD